MLIKPSIIFISILLLASCGPDEKLEREKRLKAKQDSVNRIDSLKKSSQQAIEIEKAMQDSLLQQEHFTQQAYNDSAKQAEEKLRLKWKKLTPPLPAPKNEDGPKKKWKKH
jgi:hypothetical protein